MKMTDGVEFTRGRRVISGYAEAMKHSWPTLLQSALLACLIAPASGTAFADQKPVASSNLPGVEAKYRIVRPPQPTPKPEPDEPRSGLAPGQWDVTVSGAITTDITTGGLPLPRR